MAFLGSTLISKTSVDKVFSPGTFLKSRSQNLRDSLTGTARVKDDLVQRSDEDVALGEFQEKLRLRCEDILVSMNNYTSVIDEVRDTFGTVGSLAEQYKEVIQTLRDSQNRNTFLEESEKKLRASLVELEQERNALTGQCAKLESNNQRIGADCQKLQNSLDDVSSKHWEQSSQFNALNSQYDHTRKRVSSLSRDLESIQKQLEETITERNSLSTQIADLNEKLTIENVSVQRETKIRTDLETALVGANKEIELSHQREENLTQSKDELQAKFNGLTAEIDKVRDSLSETTTQLMTSSIDYEAKIVALTSRMERFSSLLGDARDELKKSKELEAQHELLKTAHQQLNADLEASNTHLQEKDQSISTLQKTTFELEKNIASSASKSGILESNTVSLVKEKDMLAAELLKSKDGLREALQSKDGEIEILNQKLKKEEALRHQAEGALMVAHKSREALQKTIASKDKEKSAQQQAAGSEPVTDIAEAKQKNAKPRKSAMESEPAVEAEPAAELQKQAS